MPSIIPLRDYQEDALQAVLDNYNEGVTKGIVVIPTAGGKTMLSAHLVKRLGWRTVMLVHREELVDQSVKTLLLINPELSIGVIKAERNELTKHIIVASVQTLAVKERLAQLKEEVKGSPLLLISDESHHDAAPTRRHIISELNADLLLGLTATPDRGDGQSLEDIYDTIFYTIPMLRLINQGYLVEPVGLRVNTSLNLEKVRIRKGEFVESDLSEAVNTTVRNEEIVATWKDKASSRSRTAVFAVDVQHAVDLRDTFRSAGVTCEMVLGTTPTEERKQILKGFHDGQVPVLVNVGVLTEGYDEPKMDAILMARPTQSRALYTQMIGRGLRTAPDKQDCLVIDFVDGSKKHSLITLATLAGGKLSQAEAKYRSGAPVGLLEMAQEAELMLESSPLETERVDLLTQRKVPLWWWHEGDLLVARGGERHWVVIAPKEEGFIPYRLEEVRGALRPLFDRPVDEETARGIAQSSAEANPLTDPNAQWRFRTDAPSEAQKDFAKSIGVVVTPEMTKADVSFQLDRYKFLDRASRSGLPVQSPVLPQPEGAEGNALAKLVADVAVEGAIQIYTPDGRRIELFPAGPRSKYAGSLQITDGRSYPNNTWYGSIRPNGSLYLQNKSDTLVAQAIHELAEGKYTDEVHAHRKNLGNTPFKVF